jgi:hypothetical protein
VSDMLSMVLGLALIVIVGRYAFNRGRRPWVWIIVSFFLTPLVGWIGLALMEDKRKPEQRDVALKPSNRQLGIAAIVIAAIGVVGIVLTEPSGTLDISTSESPKHVSNAVDRADSKRPDTSTRSMTDRSPPVASVATVEQPTTNVRPPDISMKIEKNCRRIASAGGSMSYEVEKQCTDDEWDAFHELASMSIEGRIQDHCGRIARAGGRMSYEVMLQCVQDEVEARTQLGQN